MKLIAETAWHHEGDMVFMNSLIDNICRSSADIVKVHVLMDFDEYMEKNHPAYDTLSSWLIKKNDWLEIFNKISASGKELMALLNDTGAVELVSKCNPNYVEVHSVCLNDKNLLDSIKYNINHSVPVVLGVGGSTIYEIENAINTLKDFPIILMFGFQNYPTKYEDINLAKIKRIMQAFPDYEYGYADHTAWDEPNNLLVTMLGAAQGVQYVEKHVTLNKGENRTDFSAAISFDELEELKRQMNLLDSMNGNGLLSLNEAELKYCVPGLMKKAAILRKTKSAGEVLTWDDIVFKRSGQFTDMQQLDVWAKMGSKVVAGCVEGQAISSKTFSEE